MIHQIAQACLPHGIQTDVLTLTRDPSPEPIAWENESIHQVRCDLNIASTPFSLQALRRFKQLVNDVDLIHYHYPWPFMDMLHIAARVKKPTLVTYHSDIVKQKNLLRLYRPLARYFLNQVNGIVATSPHYIQSSDLLQSFKHKTTLIPIGIKPPTEPVCPQRRQFWQTQCGERFFLFIGVLRYYKGLSFLLDALKDLDYPVVIAGSGPLEQALKQQAQDHQLKNIQFIGEISDQDKFALLDCCHAFVFPSHLRSEAFGVSLLEAAMMGKPLISCTLQTGTSYVNVDGVTGWEVPPANPTALQHALSECWQNTALSTQRGLCARQRYETLFTAEQMGSCYAKLYHTMRDAL